MLGNRDGPGILIASSLVLLQLKSESDHYLFADTAPPEYVMRYICLTVTSSTWDSYVRIFQSFLVISS